MLKEAFRFFGMPQVAPNPHSEFNVYQDQSRSDTLLAGEARNVCKVLSNPRKYNQTEQNALRSAVGSDKASYLYSRFATALGWTTLRQAQDFYDANKGSKGGYY